MTPRQAAEVLVKARGLTRRAEHNRRTADKSPGTATARAADERAEKQGAQAEALFEQIRRYLEQL